MMKLRCPANGQPKPTIKWEKNSEPIKRKIGKVKYSKWAITLEDLISDDSGFYTCIVCNIYNCINSTTKLEVIG